MVEPIPPIDSDLPVNGATRDTRREDLEYKVLEAEAESLRLGHRETKQRFYIKWTAVVVGVSVIVGMSVVLFHVVHDAILGPVLFAGVAFSVAMIAAPIASITAITIALFIGAFRRYDDRDIEAMGNGASKAANYMRGSDNL